MRIDQERLYCSTALRRWWRPDISSSLRWISLFKDAFSSESLASKVSMVSSLSGMGSNLDNLAEMTASSARIVSLWSFGLDGAMVLRKRRNTRSGTCESV